MEIDRTESQFSLVRLGSYTENLVLRLEANNIIGRGYDSTLVLCSMYISRKHCMIMQHNQEWYIKDMGSLNGTFINEERLDPNLIYRLEVGDLIGFGIAGKSLNDELYSEDEGFYAYKLIKTRYDHSEIQDLCVELSNLMSE